ncbi:MAG: S1 RNA-binding domain-containing protein [Clostridiales bacterium]|nr:S1 RNA-binding domain-containing protein [Candidatus Cacconaster stercorequi]
MCQNRWLLPEGFHSGHRSYTHEQLCQAQQEKSVLTGTVLRCDAQQNLIVQVGPFIGSIPRNECVAPFLSGAGRDIAILSCVGRTVCFTVTGQKSAPNGDTVFLLSRRSAQQQAMEYMVSNWLSGTVIPAQITHLAPFGAFADVGCGIISMIPLSAISVSRIQHPAERFSLRQKIYARIEHIDPVEKRVYLTHKELLGTWLENAGMFRAGETVPGIIRTQKEYGVFVELTPNLTGLADLPQQPLPEGRAAAVYIKSILPEQQKIKLQVLHLLDAPVFPTPLTYRITGGRVENWQYAPTRP